MACLVRRVCPAGAAPGVPFMITNKISMITEEKRAIDTLFLRDHGRSVPLLGWLLVPEGWVKPAPERQAAGWRPMGLTTAHHGSLGTP